MWSPQYWILAALMVCALACGKSTPLSSALDSPGPGVQAGYGTPVTQGDATLSAAALWNITFDPSALTASVQPISREAQYFGDNYVLDVAQYFSKTDLRVTGVHNDGDDLVLDYTIAHPFAPAANPDGPANAANRADLGIAGITLFLLEVPPTPPVVSFFDDQSPFGKVFTNTGLITNADGYFKPSGLVETPTLVANTFPFRTLVDERGAGNRTGQPNAAPGIGNFEAQAGWQRSNWGPDRTGWTGYGMLHQGQRVTNEVRLARAALSTGAISLTVALVVKHVDPVGGTLPDERIANRLPTADNDRSRFLYRMPHGAWDVERVDLLGLSGDFDQDDDSTVDLNLHIVDWDARATETTKATLATELVASKVAVGESGLPGIAISIPGLTGVASHDQLFPGEGLVRHDDSAFGGDVGTDTGGAHDPLYYRIPLQRTAGTDDPAGFFTGLVQVRDHTSLTGGVPTDFYLHPDLAPLTANIPRSVTYQAFQVRVMPVFTDNLAVHLLSDPVPSGFHPVIVLDSYAGGMPIDRYVQCDFNGDGDFDDTSEARIFPTYQWPQIIDTAPYLFNPGLTPLPRFLILRSRQQPGGPWDWTRVDFTLGPNAPPAGGIPVLNAERLPSPATFVLESLGWSDPEGDAPLSYTITNNVTADVISDATFPVNLTSVPVTNPSHELITFQIYMNDPLHPGLSGRPLTPLTVRIDGAGPVGWGRGFAPWAFNANGGPRVVRDEAGNTYIYGIWTAAWDFGDGLRTPQSENALFIASYADSGDFRWVRTYETVDPSPVTTMVPGGIALADTDRVVVSGLFTQPMDFGGGVRTPDPQDQFVLALDTNGGYVWDRHWDIPSVSYAESTLAAWPSGDIACAGILKAGTYDFGLGSRTATGSDSTFLLKLDSEGAPVWDRLYSATQVNAHSVATTSAGAVALGGHFRGTTDFGGGARSTGLVETQGWIAVLDAHGAWLWDRVLGTPTLNSVVVSALAATPGDGGLIAIGDSSGQVDLGQGPIGIGGWAARYSNMGAWQWERFGVPDARGVAVSPGGLVAITGPVFAPQTVDLGFGPHTVAGTASDADIYVLVCDLDSTPLWANWWGGSRDERPVGLAFGVDERLAVVGTHAIALDLDPGPAQWTLAGVGPGAGFLTVVRGDTGLW